ncbi:metalloendopeptidase-like membrane protein [Halobacteroides halobius DSM 5150]|uniref:Metalloendopeptidase-like membrane protein n=1 Tax=Halobacteroides halobius (strain ATCC 35273 / DSM 5150 / MD-1) TaxID=748449 RepID=L0KAM1_HALHC|nr:M23 family metallopeptidase [Halobacteroides halobius]AGB42327.1 metalloendopeptidase-like membrane protein [Halobacteroides halobius DSM 5150]
MNKEQKDLTAKLKSIMKQIDWRRSLSVIGLFFILGASFAVYQHYNKPTQQSELSQQAKVEIVDIKTKETNYDLGSKKLELPVRKKTKDATGTKPKQAVKVTNNQVANAQFENLIMPVNGEVISSRQWYKDETLDAWRYNPGVDIAAKIGTKVKVVQDGKVEEIIKDDFKGITVIIKHQDEFKTLYGNLRSCKVKEGSPVKKGQIIGEVGDSGSDKNRLHFEIIKAGKRVPPTKYLK